MLQTYKGLDIESLDAMPADRFLYFLPWDELKRAANESALSRDEFLLEVERQKSERASEVESVMRELGV